MTVLATHAVHSACERSVMAMAVYLLFCILLVAYEADAVLRQSLAQMTAPRKSSQQVATRCPDCHGQPGQKPSTSPSGECNSHTCMISKRRPMLLLRLLNYSGSARIASRPSARLCCSQCTHTDPINSPVFFPLHSLVQ